MSDIMYTQEVLMLAERFLKQTPIFSVQDFSFSDNEYTYIGEQHAELFDLIYNQSDDEKIVVVGPSAFTVLYSAAIHKNLNLKTPQENFVTRYTTSVNIVAEDIKDTVATSHIEVIGKLNNVLLLLDPILDAKSPIKIFDKDLSTLLEINIVSEIKFV